jgi:RNase H-like domain found in reverse transcriptase/Reverse transcriptase (RNA-dependent DNA polymerase)/gag-polyprotein putative aspartyl protease
MAPKETHVPRLRIVFKLETGKFEALDACMALHLGANNSSGHIKQHLSINGLIAQGTKRYPIDAMIDSGTTGIFIDEEFTRTLGLDLVKRKNEIRLTLFDGSRAKTITHQVYARIQIGDVMQNLAFEVTKLSHYPVILGLPWLKMYNPVIDWQREEISLDPRGLTIQATETNTEEIVPKELHEYLDVFSEEEARALPPHRNWDAKIDLIEGKSHNHKGIVYPLGEREAQAQKEWINDHLSKGFIRPSKSPLSTSTFFVKKKDDAGKQTNIRLVVDYRYLNNITVKNRYPILLIGNLTDRLKNAKFFTKMDLRYGYHLVRIAEGDEWKTAFSTRYGQYEYTVMPLGLCNAPSVFQQMMNEIFHDMLDDGVLIYLDDILIWAETEEELTRLTLEVLKRLRTHKLFVKPGKCKFKTKRVEFLGVIVFEGGIEMDPGKTDAIKEWPPPKTIKQLQAFLGFCNFYRRFIKDFSRIARPLHNLTKKDKKWDWSQMHQDAFEELKKEFKLGRVLLQPNPEKRFFVECDSSGYAIGGELSQQDDEGRRRPVAFFSKSMQPAERNYDIHDRELLSIIRTFQQWRHYLEGANHTVVVKSDHKNLEIFKTTKVLTPRQVRWAEFLAGFDFVIEHQSGKEAARSDALSRRPDHYPEDRPELTHKVFFRRTIYKHNIPGKQQNIHRRTIPGCSHI